jgi:hypothetical protein
MRRVRNAFIYLVIGFTLLWLVAGLGVRAASVFSLIIAVVFDQIGEVQRFLTRPMLGPQVLFFAADLGKIFSDLGIIDDSTNWDEVASLQKAPYAFPNFGLECVCIPEANAYVWPARQAYASEIELTADISLPFESPLGICFAGLDESNYLSKFSAEEKERRWKLHCEVAFFIWRAGSGFEFGLLVPASFAEERLKTGGFGDTCVECRDRRELRGQYEVVLGHFPDWLFPPKKPQTYRTWVRESKQHFQLWDQYRKGFEKLGWTLEGQVYRLSAQHKYLTISIRDTAPWNC